MVLLFIAFLTLWIGSCGYAAARGGLPEKVMAVTFVAAAILSRVFEGERAHVYFQFSIGIFLVDMAVFAIILFLAMRSSRFWPMAMASLQAAEVLAHLAKFIGNGTLPIAYAATVVLWSLPMLALLGFATRRHRRRLKRYGIDPAWIHQLPAPYLAGGVANDGRPASAKPAG